MPLAREPQRKVRVFHEYGAPWPLWKSGTDEYQMQPSDYELSPELTDELRRWGDVFQTHFHYLDGWDSASTRQQYSDGMQGAVTRLRRELPPELAIQDEHTWCLDDPDH